MSRKSEGSIYQIPGGWRGAISLGYVNGKLMRKVIRRKTHAAVAEELRKLLTKRDKNKPIITTRRTVAQFMQEWLDVYVKPNLSHLTYRGYEQTTRMYITPMLGRIQLDQLNGAEVQACLNACRKKGLSPTSVKNINATLKTALSTAQQWQYIEINAAKNATPPKQVKYKAHPLPAEDADRLLRFFLGHRYEALYYLALMMGLRRGELIGVQWPDIDLKTGQMHVQHSLQRITGVGMTLAEVKTEDSESIVPIPALCVEALLRRQLIQEQEQVTAGAKWKQDDNFVFTSRHGRRLHAEKPIRDLKKALVALKLPDVRLHDLRHSTASLLLAKRTPMKVIQAIMRHSSFQITMDLYSHLAPSELKDTAQTMNDIFTSLVATPCATPRSTETVQ
jgi:integrase